MNGDKDCRRCYPSQRQPTTPKGCVWLHVSVQAQQCSSSAAVQQIRVGALSPMPSCLGIGGLPLVPARTPTAHWGVNSRKAGCGWPDWNRQQVHGKHGSGAQVVNVTERLVAGVERGTTGDVQRFVAQSSLGRCAADTTRRPTMNVLDCP